MFWKFDLNTTSHVDKLLDKEDVSLQELMEEDDLLQECKAQNRRLLGFLCQPQCMELLVQLITQNPPADMEEKVRFKYPNIACELLTCDAPQINDKLGGDESLLNTLYDFLRQEPPLNPLLASFFSKTIGNLIARKTEQVIGFLRAKDQFLGLVLEHIGTSAMMDLLLRLISCVEPAPLRQEVLCWLNEEKLIQRLVDLIHARQDEDRQTNASQTLCDLIRLSRDQGNPMHETLAPDPLLSALESQQCVEQILQNMFDGEHSESCMVSGTQILLTLLENRRPSVDPLLDSLPQGYERPHTVSSSILQGIEPRLKDFHQLLLHPPKKASILTTIGVLDEPLGNARLHATRLIAALLHTNTPSVNQELCRLTTMDLLLDLFFRYTWNNFLHFQVELCVAAILSHSLQDGKIMADMEEDAGNGNAGNMESFRTSEDVTVTHVSVASLSPTSDHEDITVTHVSVAAVSPTSDHEDVTVTHVSVAALFPTSDHEDLTVTHVSVAALSPTSDYEDVTVTHVSVAALSPTSDHEDIMVTHLFQQCRLIQRILGAWETNDTIQAEGGMRRGNMGHLTRIANAVVQNMETGPMQAQISDFITELPADCRGRWESFVEATLTETNRRNTVDLGERGWVSVAGAGARDCRPTLSLLSHVAQAFSDYQIQQITAHFVDQFGFNDEEFVEQENNINAPFDRIAEINFRIDADDDSSNDALFEACCNEHIQQFDDDEDIWEEKEPGYGTQVKSRTRFGMSQSSEDSSRSDLENGEPAGGPASDEEEEERRDVETPRALSPISAPKQKDGGAPDESGWTAVFDEPVNAKPPTPGVALDVGANVWDSPVPETAPPEEKGWAKFTDFQPFCCSESGPRCSSPVDTESSGSEGHSRHSQDTFFSTTSPCAWNVCVARKAPVVGSDSSSSGGSDSEEEEKTNIITETISTGAGHETIRLTVDAKNEKATFSSNPDGLIIDQLNISDRTRTAQTHPCNSSTETPPGEQSAATSCATSTQTAGRDQRSTINRRRRHVGDRDGECTMERG
ncbi:serine/threonine-protein phosphatase 6 regulatory subunit 2 [Ascaphus truei]|uniref:serine/threonine-protein phosphatase 6 regulatory subunit 2 n=1 Tax=Ascaphus truei TaxID=8439 RepID=UPI003F59886A